MSIAKIHVAQMVDYILRRYDAIPVLNHLLIHFLNVMEVAENLALIISERENVSVPKVGIADDVDFTQNCLLK